MKADLTRVTFDPAKRYRTVLHQQGRVQLDADHNEAQSIQNERLDAALTDVVGGVGVPRDRAGFAVAVSGGDLTLGAGRLYAGGIACVCDGASLNAQPYTRRRVEVQNLDAGRYLVYLDVWERTVTALEDPHLREPALNGVDTAARTQVVWQARLLKVGAAATCATLGAWAPTDPTGRLEAVTAPVTEDTSLCSLPPLGGYTRGENQLYRIEVHQGATTRGATVFKWSRDNGAVAAGITTLSGGTTVGLDRLDPDTSFGFGDAAWAEAADEHSELDFETTALLRVSNPDVSLDQVTVTPAATFDGAAKPKLRRWDGQFNGAAKVALEDGLSVNLSEGSYRTGDYWLVPARAAGDGLSGTLDWPGGLQPPQGIGHRYAALALVDVSTARAFGLVADCRDLFPPLTDLRASDVGIEDRCDFGSKVKTVQDAIDVLCKRVESCTIVIRPGEDLARRFGEIKEGQDAQICFPVGEFVVPKSLIVDKKGHLKLSGSGKGTRLVASGSESALRFTNCKSVSVRDLDVVAQRAGTEKGNLGALTFEDCPEVLIEAVDATSATTKSRASACLTAYRGRSIRVRDCDLQPGDRGIGLLVVDFERVQVEGNSVAPSGGTRPRLFERAEDSLYRAKVRGKLISYAGTPTRREEAAAAADGTRAKGARLVTQRNDRVKIGNFTLAFQTPDPLKGSWQARIDESKPTNVETVQRAVEALYRIVDRIVLSKDIATRSPALNKILTAFETSPNAVEQGIVVAGATAKDVRIEGNSLSGVQQGIHVGLSRHAQSPLAGRVRIGGNVIETLLRSDSVGERHGIFVGNCESLHIEDNRIALQRSAGTDSVVEGIRVFGRFGAYLLVRSNHLDGFNIGIHVRPTRNDPNLSPSRTLWRVTDNLLTGSGAMLQKTAEVVAKDNVPT